MNVYKEFESFNKENDNNIVFNALNFVSTRFKHSGKSGMPQKRDINSILNFAIQKNNQINCRLLSIILSTLLQYNGIKATHITCLPKEEFFNDCHVVVEAILPNGKAVMLDPSFNLFFADNNGEFMSTKEVVSAFKNSKKIEYNKNAKHNLENFDFKWYKNFMLKCSTRFQRPEPYNAEDTEGRLQLWNENYNWKHAPVGFVVTRNEKEFWNF